MAPCRIEPFPCSGLPRLPRRTTEDFLETRSCYRRQADAEIVEPGATSHAVFEPEPSQPAAETLCAFGCGTLARCAEFGRMHVHTGQEKFPDLPRF